MPQGHTGSRVGQEVGAVRGKSQWQKLLLWGFSCVFESFQWALGHKDGL